MMLSAAPPAPNPRGGERSIFRIQLRSGIWGVKLDGKFYGDFRGLNLALESAREKARELRGAGRDVHIVTLSSGGAVLTREVLAAG